MPNQDVKIEVRGREVLVDDVDGDLVVDEVEEELCAAGCDPPPPAAWVRAGLTADIVWR